jgi:septal ring factor EnvC (AmiA/AmiB activator)
LARQDYMEAQQVLTNLFQPQNLLTYFLVLASALMGFWKILKYGKSFDAQQQTIFVLIEDVDRLKRDNERKDVKIEQLENKIRLHENDLRNRDNIIREQGVENHQLLATVARLEEKIKKLENTSNANSETLRRMGTGKLDKPGRATD